MKIVPALSRVMAVMLAVMLCGMPELARAVAFPQQDQSQPSPQSTTEQQPTQNQAPAATSPGTIVPNPAQPPLQPVENLPQAPSATQQQTSAPNQSSTPQAPAGAAAAQKGVTAGGAASRPAGNAIAPAKQRQVRSLLIKLGAIAGAAVAIGTVVALSKGTSSKPPGAK